MARVLLVDDSMYQRNKLRKTLELAGYEVLECNDGEEGLSMVASIKPDCVMLDLIMPKVSGMEVLQELHEKQVTIPVIIHTSDIQEETKKECLALGAVAFLNKPSRDEEVLAAIAQALKPQDKEGVLHALHEKQLTIPVIVHTSDIQEETKQECLALGTDAFLNKPSRDEEVLAAITQALKSQDKESGNASIT